MFKGLSSFELKLIAIITMLIDHTGMILFPQYIIFRQVGRIAFPVFCFLIVQGVLHTSDIKKYKIRLLIFAVISEIPFDLAAHGKIADIEHQNVFFTLFIGLCLIDGIQRLEGQYDLFLKIFYIVAALVWAELLNTDYGAYGVLMILIFYLFRQQTVISAVSIAAVNIAMPGQIQTYGIFALFPIYLYNGKKGMALKYFFYLFYPLHLLVLYFIRVIV